MVEVKVESHKLDVASYRHTLHPFRSMPIAPSIPEIQNFLHLTLKIQGEGEKTMMLHNYRSREFHITSNGINPSSGFRDMVSTMSGPSAASFDKLRAMGKPIWGKWANYYHCAQPQILEKSIKL